MLRALDDAGVEFLLVGAHALSFHGILRATGDIDFFVRPTTENARRVIEALIAFGAPVVAHGVSISDFERPDSVYEIGLPPRRIDLLTSISGVEFEDAWASREHASLAGVDVSVIGRDALIRNKRAAGRDEDRLNADAPEDLRR